MSLSRQFFKIKKKFGVSLNSKSKSKLWRWFHVFFFISLESKLKLSQKVLFCFVILCPFLSGKSRQLKVSTLEEGTMARSNPIFTSACFHKWARTLHTKPLLHLPQSVWLHRLPFPFPGFAPTSKMKVAGTDAAPLAPRLRLRKPH